MEEGEMQKVKDAIDKAASHTKAFGVKAVKEHIFLREMLTLYEEKKVLKVEKKTDKEIEKLKEDIEQHLVKAAEDDEEKIALNIAVDHSRMYTIVYFMSILAKHGILSLKEFGDRYEKKLKPKLSEEKRKEVKGLIKEFKKEWIDDLSSFRKLINSSYATSKGGKGFANALFEKLHKQGFAYRRKEKTLTKDVVKDEKRVDKLIKKIPGAKSSEELKKYLEDLKGLEQDLVQKFAKLEKMLFATWDSMIHHSYQLVQVVRDATVKHELPTKDKAEMEEVQSLLQHLDEKELHSFRIIEKQLDGYAKQLEI